MTRNYQRIDEFDEAKVQAIGEHVRAILTLLGEDPTREGVLKTPERVAKSRLFCTQGYGQNPIDIINSAKFKEEYRQMILVKDIELYSTCEHHLLPFFGKAHIAYLPKNGRVIGLSKLARIVNSFARRPQLQERLTAQIADFLCEHLVCQGVAVVIEAEHLCMTMRGVKASGALTQTSALRGKMREGPTRAEVMSLLKGD
jgi:GTP cyclohydrolase I